MLDSRKALILRVQTSRLGQMLQTMVSPRDKAHKMTPDLNLLKKGPQLCHRSLLRNNGIAVENVA